MKILALESSAAAASVAVCEDEELVAQSLQRTGLTHSATLLPMLEDLLKNAGLSLQDMDLLAVAAGPGSFTGLRIGVSALKGLAWALDKPCAACSTLESMAWQMAHLEVWCDGGGVCRRHTLITDRIEDETIAPYELCPVMDARRSQVYNARFAVSGGAPVRLTEDRAVSLTDLLAEVKNSQKTQILIGDGAKLCYTAFQESGVPVQLAPPHLRFQTAWGVARCALEQARRGESTTAFALRVDYHRLSQAERERLERAKSGEWRAESEERRVKSEERRVKSEEQKTCETVRFICPWATLERSFTMENKVHVLDHPLLQHKLTILRDKNTGVKEFREIVSEIAALECYEATRDLPLEDVEISTPIATGTFKTLAGKKLAVVPILRAGLGMVEGILKMIPSAKVGHIGLYRDPETHKPVKYYCKMPADIAERDVIILDPMLATGGSASAAVSFMKEYGCKHIKLMNILAAPEGIACIQREHPDVDIYVAGVDEKLNERAYIVPGLGDAGDRIFGTK